jgi:hypothetical protein
LDNAPRRTEAQDEEYKTSCGGKSRRRGRNALNGSEAHMKSQGSIGGNPA